MNDRSSPPGKPGASPASTESAAGPSPRWRPDRLDSAEFARLGAQLSGTFPISQMHRLAGLLADQEGEVHWHASGRRQDVGDRRERDWLELGWSATVRLPCNRCTQPVAVDLAGDRRFALLPDEDSAARLDEEAEDFDALVHSAHFDLKGLIEDEIIMTLPLAPAHPDCPLPGGEALDVDAEPEPNPFSALASLKGSVRKH